MVKRGILTIISAILLLTLCIPSLSVRADEEKPLYQVDFSGLQEGMELRVIDGEENTCEPEGSASVYLLSAGKYTYEVTTSDGKYFKDSFEVKDGNKTVKIEIEEEPETEEPTPESSSEEPETPESTEESQTPEREGIEYSTEDGTIGLNIGIGGKDGEGEGGGKPTKESKSKGKRKIEQEGESQSGTKSGRKTGMKKKTSNDMEPSKHQKKVEEDEKSETTSETTAASQEETQPESMEESSKEANTEKIQVNDVQAPQPKSVNTVVYHELVVEEQVEMQQQMAALDSPQVIEITSDAMLKTLMIGLFVFVIGGLWRYLCYRRQL